MQKKHILDEIRRTAAENGGIPLGIARFKETTGIERRDWYGKHWARWGDALVEAGYEANKLQEAFADDFVLDKLIELIQDLDKFPTSGEIRLRSRTDGTFPTHGVFRRLGRKAELARKVVERCDELGELDAVRAICMSITALKANQRNARPTLSAESDSSIGSVYLMKSGPYYKIGRSNSVGRRAYEIGIQLPEEITLVHSIRTDDPTGIEAYWHSRFAGKRKKGEWFSLTREDVNAFKRRKFM